MNREKAAYEGFEFHERTIGFAEQPIAASRELSLSQLRFNLSNMKLDGAGIFLDVSSQNDFN